MLGADVMLIAKTTGGPPAFWEQVERRGAPQLATLATRLAAVAASSAALERFFSCMGLTKTRTRNRLGQGKVTAMAMITSHQREKQRQAQQAAAPPSSQTDSDADAAGPSRWAAWAGSATASWCQAFRPSACSQRLTACCACSSCAGEPDSVHTMEDWQEAYAIFHGDRERLGEDDPQQPSHAPDRVQAALVVRSTPMAQALSRAPPRLPESNLPL